LGELSAIQALGEVVHLWQRGIVDDELCGCGKPFSRCEFWTGVGRRAFGGWDDVDVAGVAAARRRADRMWSIPQVALVRRRSGARVAAAVLAQHHGRVYDAAARLSGVSTVVDSSKHPSLAYCLRGDPSIDLRVVHVVRDSRGVAYSWTKTVERPEATRNGSAAWMTRYAPSRSAVLWSLHNTCIEMLATLGTPVMLVRYESFLRAPAQTLVDVARFAGLAVDPAELRFVADGQIALRPAHSAAGNPLRFRSGTLPLRPDDAWRALLPRPQRLTVTALTYPQLHRYGYVRRAGRGRP
jgi:hypothetical protein